MVLRTEACASAPLRLRKAVSSLGTPSLRWVANATEGLILATSPESLNLECNMHILPKVMRAKQACEYLSISKSFLYKLIATGHLPKGKKIWGRSVIWYREDLDRILEETKGVKR